MTKWGVVGFSEALRQEALHASVRVTCVEPGFVDTELQGHNENPVVVDGDREDARADRRACSSADDIAQRDRLRGRPAAARQHQRDPRSGPTGADSAERRSHRRSYVITYSACQRRRRAPAEHAAIDRGRDRRPRVRALREAMGLSLRDLAERSGVSAPMLSQVERGETSPTLAVAARIAAGLELTLSQLLRLDEDRHVVVVRAGERPHGAAATATARGADPAAARPARRRLAAHARAGRGDRRRRTTRRCTSPAAARPPSSSSGDARAGRRRRAPRARAPATASPSTPTCRTTSRTTATSRRRLLAVVAAGPAARLAETDAARRMFDKIWERPRGRRRPDLHRPAPRPRGHLAAGLRRAAPRRPQGPPARQDARHRRPQRADRRHAGRAR